MMNMIESGDEHDYEQSCFWWYWLLLRACLRLITSTLDTDDEHVLVWLWTHVLLMMGILILIANILTMTTFYFDDEGVLMYNYYKLVICWRERVWSHTLW